MSFVISSECRSVIPGMRFQEPDRLFAGASGQAERERGAGPRQRIKSCPPPGPRRAGLLQPAGVPSSPSGRPWKDWLAVGSGDDDGGEDGGEEEERERHGTPVADVHFAISQSTDECSEPPSPLPAAAGDGESAARLASTFSFESCGGGGGGGSGAPLLQPKPLSECALESMWRESHGAMTPGGRPMSRPGEDGAERTCLHDRMPVMGPVEDDGAPSVSLPSLESASTPSLDSASTLVLKSASAASLSDTSDILSSDGVARTARAESSPRPAAGGRKPPAVLHTSESLRQDLAVHMSSGDNSCEVLPPGDQRRNHRARLWRPLAGGSGTAAPAGPDKSAAVTGGGTADGEDDWVVYSSAHSTGYDVDDALTDDGGRREADRVDDGEQGVVQLAVGTQTLGPAKPITHRHLVIRTP